MGRLECWLAFVSCIACKSPGQPDPTPRVSARAPPSSSAPAPVQAKKPELPPLSGAAWLERLEPEPKSVSFVAVPVGARERRPILVAVHGAGDRPEWACGGWRIAAEAFPFVVCPQGLPIDRNFAWSNSAAISSAVDAALRAVRARFKDYVAEGPMIYAGFSQGAILAEPLLLSRVADFPTAIFAEGGLRTLENPAFAGSYSKQGGRRVMIVCGEPACRRHAARVAPALRRQGLDVLISGDVHSGHNLNEPMQRALRRDWPALIEGLAGWTEYPRYRWP